MLSLHTRRACRGPLGSTKHSSATRLPNVAPLRAKRQSIEEALTERQRNTARLRSEAETPFRSLRLVAYGFGALSASIGFLVSIPQLAGALMNPQSVLTVDEVVRNIGIDLGAAGACAFLYNQDWKARARQMVRLQREETLAALQLELANGRLVTVGDLRGFARLVICAGSPQQLRAALEAAEPHREALTRAGVLFVPVPIYEGEGDALPRPGPDDVRWRAAPSRLDQWGEWFGQQLELATSATSQNGLYMGLRLDGRVRASGMGLPPWPRFAAELAPLEGEGAWSGFMDGFDGEIKVFNG